MNVSGHTFPVDEHPPPLPFHWNHSPWPAYVSPGYINRDKREEQTTSQFQLVLKSHDEFSVFWWKCLLSESTHWHMKILFAPKKLVKVRMWVCLSRHVPLLKAQNPGFYIHPKTSTALPMSFSAWSRGETASLGWQVSQVTLTVITEQNF